MCGLDDDAAACLLSFCGKVAGLGSEENPSPGLHGPDGCIRSICTQAGRVACGEKGLVP